MLILEYSAIRLLETGVSRGMSSRAKYNHAMFTGMR